MAGPSFADHDGWIWMDGEFIEWRDAKAHILTHALHYGSSVFEGERSYDGVIFKSKEHSDRLVHSAKTLGMDVPVTSEELCEIKNAVMRKNGIQEGYIRPVMWRGSEMMGISAQANTIHVAVAAWVWPSYFDPAEKIKGIKLKMSPWRRPAENMAPVHAKAAGLYMICTLAKHEAEAEGFQDALMLDYRGYVAEATGANVFFVIDGKLHTPLPDCFLNGITRQTAIDLAHNRGIEVIERHMQPEEMANATECFVTGTAAEITPVSQIGEYSFTPGDICKTLVQDYEDLVRGRLTLGKTPSLAVDAAD
ncbi:MAG: branched-chain amino acid aminotransferase [Alphaproteobacteria bacterium]|nr:branched-chain amino acid aminotransferase [Alphaproteobacteria bacterium]